MWYVYILNSQKYKKYFYIGFTNNLKRRLAEHNYLQSKLSTSPYCPLEFIAYIAVKKEKIAQDLEKYFKSGSGRAFLKKRILSDKANKA